MADYLRARYGRTSFVARQRAVAALGTLAALLAVTFIFRVSTSSRVHFELSAFTVVDAHSVSVTWQVSRPADSETFCVVRAQNMDRQDVGYATVTVPAGPAVVHMTYHLATESKAILAEVLGCSTHPTMRVAKPAFPPGVTPPKQALPGVAPAA